MRDAVSAMTRDFYAIFGVAADASPESIRHAYRRLVRSIHPDTAGKHADAARFREIHEAYAVLSDPERRLLYDRSRARPSRTRASARGVESLRGRAGVAIRKNPRFTAPDARIFRLRRDFLGGTPLCFETGVRRLRLDVVLDSEEALYGCRLPFEVPVRSVCTRCGGSGDEGLWACMMCAGSGVVETRVPVVLDIEPGARRPERYQVSLGKIGYGEVVLAVTVFVR